MTSIKELLGSLDGCAREPLYLQLTRKLKVAIDDEQLIPGQFLPTERDMAEEFDVSRVTVRKALSTLVNEDLLIRRQGAGTFIAARVEKNFSQLTSFSEDMVSRGRKPSSTWLGKTKSDVTREEAMNCGLSPGTKVYRLNRIRYADETPMSLEYTIVPTFCIPSVDAVEGSLYEALEKSGYRPVRALQRLRAVLLSKEHAKLLEANPNDAGLLVERRGFLGDGRVIEIAHSYYRGDTYDFVAELSG